MPDRSGMPPAGFRIPMSNSPTIYVTTFSAVFTRICVIFTHSANFLKTFPLYTRPEPFQVIRWKRPPGIRPAHVPPCAGKPSAREKILPMAIPFTVETVPAQVFMPTAAVTPRGMTVLHWLWNAICIPFFVWRPRGMYSGCFR